MGDPTETLLYSRHATTETTSDLPSTVRPVMFYSPDPVPGGRQPGWTRRLALILAAISMVAVVAVGAAWRPAVAEAARTSLTILGASAASLDLSLIHISEPTSLGM